MCRSVVEWVGEGGGVLLDAELLRGGASRVEGESAVQDGRLLPLRQRSAQLLERLLHQSANRQGVHPTVQWCTTGANKDTCLKDVFLRPDLEFLQTCKQLDALAYLGPADYGDLEVFRAVYVSHCNF